MPRISRIALAFFVSTVLTLVSACQDEPAFDAVTSASPMVSEVELTADSHPGWNQADCFSCHGDIHRAGYVPPDCLSCHGRNGSPFRLQGCDDHDCTECHAETHDGLGFQAPGDCRACHPFASSDECAHVDSPRVVVVGAGGGGLSAAAVLAQAGIDVVVLERHHRVGGMMVSFTRGDYRFEASLHGFDGLDEVEGFNTPIFEDLDLLGRVSPIRSDPMYRVVFPDLTFEVPADIDEYRRRLQERFPHESENLDALFAELADFQRIFVGAIHYQETGELPEDVTEEDLLRFEEMMSITLDQFLLPYISDPELLALLTQLTGFAGNRPGDISALLFMAMWNSYHRGGYFYFDGGSQALTDAMAQVIIENGGAIEVNTEVTRIEVADGRATRVRTRDNRCFDAQYVISNVPAPVTILELVGREHWPEWYVESVEGMEEGGAPFVVFLGVDHDYTSEFGGTHELFTAATIDQEQSQQAMLTCDPALLPLGISNYSVVEPDVAPPGKNAITLTTLVPWECRDEWGWNDSHQTYREVKDEFARLLVERVDQEYLPGLVSHVEVMEVATPQTIWAFTLSPAGSMVGWDNTPAQTMTNRLPQETPIENLFLVGAWTFPGGGQSTVMNSGRSAARLVITAEEGAR